MAGLAPADVDRRLPRHDDRDERGARARGRGRRDDHDARLPRHRPHRAPPAAAALLGHAGHPVAGAAVRRGAATARSSPSGSCRRPARCSCRSTRTRCAAAARELRDEGVEAVAVCFLFSYLNPEHERRAAAIVREEMPDAFVTDERRHLPAVPRVRALHDGDDQRLRRPEDGQLPRPPRRGARGARASTGELHVMMSSGGVASVRAAAERPVTLLLSGPAAGILGGQWAGALAGRRRLITFDMGGTSADIGIVTEDGVTRGVGARHVGRRLSAARADARRAHDRRRRRLDRVRRRGRRLPRRPAQRGRRARARPATATAAQEPTISDAHVVLGRLDPDRFLGGRMKLDRDAAVDAVQRLADQLGLSLLETAEGILTIANSNMARAIRSRTIEKGHDPREFALVAFGGAGPLHAAEVADSLEHPGGARAAAPRASPPPAACSRATSSTTRCAPSSSCRAAIDAERLEPRARPSSRQCCAAGSSATASRPRTSR